jgi:hypothetical protein
MSERIGLTMSYVQILESYTHYEGMVLDMFAYRFHGSYHGQELLGSNDAFDSLIKNINALLSPLNIMRKSFAAVDRVMS